MQNLITDRTQSNVLRLQRLSKKGYSGMTEEEKREWLGDPLAEQGANLFPNGPFYSSTVELKHKYDSVIATATTGGTYLYAVSIIGEAGKYENKTYTLSVEYVRILGGGKPQIALYWHDDNGSEYAGASLTEAGSTTFAIGKNTGKRAYLAMYVYATTDTSVSAGAQIRYGKVMFTLGDKQHGYAPYNGVLPTNATKGAYNYSDLNRVEIAVAEIAEDTGLHLVTKADWTMWDVPRSSDMERYLSNVKAIRNAFSTDVDLPNTMKELTYAVANNIEKVLYEGHEQLQDALCSDELFCGEV